MAGRKVPVGDLKLGAAERRALQGVIDSGRFTEGERVRLFEEQWASYVGTKYCIATSSGSAALVAGLTALKYLYGLPSGTKVIATPLTYIATINAIVVVGFEPVFADVDRETFGLEPRLVEELLRRDSNPKAYRIILPVHLLGYPAKMAEVNDIARRYGLITFEDAAQAHGSVYMGRRVGSMSALADFSFYIGHTIPAGEMGAVTTSDPAIDRLVRKIKAQGRFLAGEPPPDAKEDFYAGFTHDLIGYNFKATEFGAALALTQIGQAEALIQKRRENVRYLNERLADLAHILRLPQYQAGVSYMAYPLAIRHPHLVSRKELRARLEEEGVESRPLFSCVPTQEPAYAHLKGRYEGQLPHAEFLGRHAFYVGCHQYLERDDLDYMAEVFHRILEPWRKEAEKAELRGDIAPLGG